MLSIDDPSLQLKRIIADLLIPDQATLAICAHLARNCSAAAQHSFNRGNSFSIHFLPLAFCEFGSRRPPRINFTTRKPYDLSHTAAA